MASDRRPTDPVRTDESSDMAMAVLARETRSASVARSWLRGFLDGAGLPEAVQADAALVISELVTNALRHGLGEIVARATIGDDGHVDVSVTDSGSEQPAAAGGRSASASAGSASTWSPRSPTSGEWLQFPGGKTVWARIAIAPVLASADRQRADGARPARPWAGSVAGSPRRCARPPKATATMRNQPQPTTRPADHVGQPVHAEQRPTGGDGDSDQGRAGGQQRLVRA